MNGRRRVREEKTRTLLRLVWIAAGLAVLLALARDAMRPRLTTPRPLIAVERAENASWVTGEFRADGVFPTTTAGDLPSQLATAGSWLGTDAWQGRAETVWFDVGWQPLRVGVAGYPRNDDT